MMVSVWWAVGMFLLGAYAGILVFALMSMAAREHAQHVKEVEAVEHDGLRPVKLEEEWMVTPSVEFRSHTTPDRRMPTATRRAG